MNAQEMVCANHPGRPTTLRCNRCEKPICSRCAVLTPVGYRCKECIKGQQAAFETARWWDYPAAFLIAALGVGLGVALLRFIGYWGFLVAPAVGGGLAEAVRAAVGRRRSRKLPLAAAAGGALGVLFNLTLAGFGLGLIWPVAYGALMVSTLVYRIRGIHI